ncbi:apolipoprotein D-like [Aplochiton taeniatus]
MQTFQVISLTLLSFLAASAQTFLPGKCPTPAVQENFDAARYLGRWHEIQKLPAVFQKGECCQATYTLKSPGVVGVFNEELLADGTINSISGTAQAKDSSEPAKLEVSFSEISRESPYWVLSTDYDRYSLVYGCSNMDDCHVDFVWILSRQPALPAETIEELINILASNGIPAEKLQVTNQEAAFCSSMPE